MHDTIKPKQTNEAPLSPEEEEESLYTGMSLRREHVENEALPAIRIFCGEEAEEEAREISYGVEEEGLPHRIVADPQPFRQALRDLEAKGLGVAIAIEGEEARVYSRQLKKEEALLSCGTKEPRRLRILGQNGARIVKHKPFLLDP